MMLPRPDRAAILARLPPLPEPLYWGVRVNHVHRNRWEVSIQMRCRHVDIVGVVNNEEPDAATVEDLVDRAIQQAQEVGAISAPPPAPHQPSPINP